eukprot:PhF_6_TR40157/c0_g1_i1/m.59452/K01190/lacZ; beta-galactosidase
MTLFLGLTITLLLTTHVLSQGRTVYSLDKNWRFLLDNTAPKCNQPINTAFPLSYDNQQCYGLTQAPALSETDCANACCAESTCEIYQWCGNQSCGGSSGSGGCWIGTLGSCGTGPGWISRARKTTPQPSPTNNTCTDPRCDPTTNDTTWRVVNVPHDFVVEGTFTPTASMSHGYLPFGVGWYRKHFQVPAGTKSTDVMWIDLDGVQTISTVWLNGVLLGTHNSGYTPSRYFVNTTLLKLSGDNVLVIKADATNPDGWWYDGGGVYRHVSLTRIQTNGPYIVPWGVYAPSKVIGPITWNQGIPTAQAEVMLYVELKNSLTTTSTFEISVEILSGQQVVGKKHGQGSVQGDGKVQTWNDLIVLPKATLWHLVPKPQLYTVVTTLSSGGVVVDQITVTIGIRKTKWDAATGFYLNEVSTKILGNANHQDFAGLGVAIPDHLQAHRIAKLKEMGANGWRTAHNPPNEALLDAADQLGFLVWDENHRNGQDSECELLIRRDRNHPSVVIWSLCNEVLCNTNDSVGDALRLKNLIRTLDPWGGRPVSANQNGYIGPNTPLDVQGFDYATNSYDQWHNQAPNIPSISSETSSAVSDRDEYVNDPNGGHVSGYDVNYPGWGQSAQQAWGGVGEPNGQGILTRPFISGGWTWTGWDYKGEPTPYQWPDINSHFGILDICGFPKDRYYWYKSWFPTVNVQQGGNPPPTEVYVFPHWNWAAGDNVNVWIFSNANSVELLLNNVSISGGKIAMPKYGHVEMNVTFQPGVLTATGYDVKGAVVGTMSRVTAQSQRQLRISLKDGVGAPSLIAGCSDVALVQVEVVDVNGEIVPYASNNVTFTVSGPGVVLGTGNGNPASHTNDKSSVREAYHGRLIAIIQETGSVGMITVSVTSPGLIGVGMTIDVINPNAEQRWWCPSRQQI